MEQESQKKKLLIAFIIGMVFGVGIVGGIVWRLESLKAKKEAAGWVIAQQLADESRSMNQLRGVGIALIMFARSNGDVFPPEESWLDELLATGHVVPEMLVPRLEGEGGDGVLYIFVPGPNSLDPQQILAYEDPKHMDDGVHVVFADTTAMKMDHAEFEKMLAEQLAVQNP